MLYQPPKQSNAGTIISGAGDLMMSAGGIATATGAGAPIGLALAGVGAIAKVTGSIIDGTNQNKMKDYNELYAKVQQGEQNAATNAFNNFQAYKQGFVSNAVNSSIKNINQMIEPTSVAKTSLSENRLI